MFGIDDALVIAGGAAVGSALIGADAAKDASNTQAGATRQAAAEQARQYDLTRSDQAPYRSAGKSALERLRSLLGLPQDQQLAAGDAYLKANPDVAANQFYGSNPYQHFLDHGQSEGRQWPTAQAPAATPSDFGDVSRKFNINDFWQDPVTQASYQSGLDLGTKALKNAAPLTTGLDSGAAMKELTKFGTDYTGQKAGESYNRFTGDQNSVFNKLMAMIGGGQVANNQVAAAGTNMANNVGNLVTAGANAQGASRIAGANAWGGALGNISNWWNQNAMLDRVDQMRGSWRTPPYNPMYQGSFDYNTA